MGQTIALGVGIFIIVLVFIALIYGIGGAIFAAAWNFLMPALWPAAPHLSWKAGVAAAWLIGVLQTVFGGGIKFNKKDFE